VPTSAPSVVGHSVKESNRDNTCKAVNGHCHWPLASVTSVDLISYQWPIRLSGIQCKPFDNTLIGGNRTIVQYIVSLGVVTNPPVLSMHLQNKLKTMTFAKAHLHCKFYSNNVVYYN